jgi:hypothetical protein
MGVCTICGEAAGFLLSIRPECKSRDGSGGSVNSIEGRPAPDIGQLVYGRISERLGRPYELESGRIEAVVNDVQGLNGTGSSRKQSKSSCRSLIFWKRMPARALCRAGTELLHLFAQDILMKHPSRALPKPRGP